MAQGVDWQTVKAKQEEIAEQFHLHYPMEGSDVSTKEYITTDTQAYVSLFPLSFR